MSFFLILNIVMLRKSLPYLLRNPKKKRKKKRLILNFRINTNGRKGNLISIINRHHHSTTLTFQYSSNTLSLSDTNSFLIQLLWLILAFNACKTFSLRLCLVEYKIFFECKIFSSENIFRKGKYFQVFGCISKNALENIF